MSLFLFKFGGASVRDSDNIRNIGTILEKYRENTLVLVISAMGKTTNALEKVFYYFDQDGKPAALKELDDITATHLETAANLGLNASVLKERYDSFVTAAFGRLEKSPDLSHAAIYDQVVSLGELFSSTLISMYLEKEDFNTQWTDIRDIIYTDNNFREAIVDFAQTQKAVDQHIKPHLKDSTVTVTQGFIGRGDNGQTVTLGREGSDYTAAILAYCLDVKDLTIWKDVPGVLTGDPRKFDNVEKLDRMSYKEAIEMTYYGAQVIHPKTIRPLQNKGIRLHVKSFLDPDKEGTIISADGLLNYPPIVVIQENVILVQISSRDFSFIAENHLSQIFSVLNSHRIKLCSMRNSAISFTICIKDPGKREFDAFSKSLEQDFFLDIFKGLDLYTLRYAHEGLIKKLTKNKVVLFEEKMNYTIQMAVRPALELKEKE